MISITEEVIAEMVQSIVRAVHPETVYLFGSRANGAPTGDSDIDLLVVEAEPFGERRSRLQEIRRIRQALSAFHVPKDILVYSRGEVSRWRQSTNHIVAHCLREGRLLYGRP